MVIYRLYFKLLLWILQFPRGNKTTYSKHYQSVYNVIEVRLYITKLLPSSPSGCNYRHSLLRHERPISQSVYRSVAQQRFQYALPLVTHTHTHTQQQAFTSSYTVAATLHSCTRDSPTVKYRLDETPPLVPILYG